MAAGDITATITACEGSAAIKTYLDAQSTGAATSKDDTTSYQVFSDGCREGVFWVVKIVRAAA